MNELSIVNQYPPEKYNLLGNTMVVTEVPEIMSPVMQAVQIDPNPDHGDVYIQQKAKNGYTDKGGKSHPPTPNLYALTKNGLKKLADGAGIKMIKSEHVLPASCQKCAAVNGNLGKVLPCGMCGNRDIAFRVTISVPQLTGEVLYVTDTNEINVEHQTADMSEKQKAEFLRFMPQICEAKAMNGAIRTALHLKGTYTLEELKKPFVVAYLVPNMNNPEVKQAAITNMFESNKRLFGGESQAVQATPVLGVSTEPMGEIPESAAHFIDEPVGEPVVESVVEPVIEEPAPVQQATQPSMDDDAPLICEKCGTDINQKVFKFSVERYGRPLCYKCQRS